jgi:hypothetical protein
MPSLRVRWLRAGTRAAPGFSAISSSFSIGTALERRPFNMAGVAAAREKIAVEMNASASRFEQSPRTVAVHNLSGSLDSFASEISNIGSE